jgi:hypothetical protein
LGKHLVNVAAAAIRAGVEEGRVQLEETHAELMASVTKAVLFAASLSLTEAQRREGLPFAAKELRAIGTSAGPPPRADEEG